MPQSFSMRLFDRWLEQNRARFHHPPTAIVRRKQSRTFRFAGVTPSIWGHVCDWGSIVVGVDYRGENWDLIADLDIAPARLATGGYVCQLCAADAQKVYPTRASLWIEHGFESLLDWSNTHFRPDLNVMLFQTKDGGATWVKLRRRADDMAVAAERGLVADYPLLG